MIAACILAYNHEAWIRTCLESVKDAVDRIIVIDGGSKDRTLEIVAEYPKTEVHYHRWMGNIGMQRNNYLCYLVPGEWALVMDADEVLSDNGFILKERLVNAKADVFDVKMVHFMWNFSRVDATKPIHYVPRRLFKYNTGMVYPNTRHAILKGIDEDSVGKMDEVTIFHCGYLSGMPDIAKKYKEHMDTSEIHSKEFLDDWRKKLVMGTYETSGYTGPYPEPLREMFGL
jgi:glycosyltransferase involved in cell wall biosynthesis